MGTLSPGTEHVRIGSPFAAGSAAPGCAGSAVTGSAGSATTDLTAEGGALPLRAQPEPMGEGVYRETATAAAYAAWMLLLFAIAGYVWFPVGGIAITLLGGTMGVMGLSSRCVKRSAVAAIGHGVILLSCYLRLL